MSPQSGKPRGAPAKSEVVDLYRLLYQADHPMSLDEIASEVGGMPPAYRTAANIAYREHLSTKIAKMDEPIVVVEVFTDEQKHQAWLWWLTQLIRSCVNTKRISVDTAGSKRPVNENKYTANRDNPPVVKRTEIIEQHVTAYWTPEFAEIGARHMTGMKFLKEAEKLLAAGSLTKQVQQVLQDGITAIRVPRRAKGTDAA